MIEGDQDTAVRIGHYLLGRTIGRGGFAKVREARHDLTGLRVAVKIINKSKMKNKNMISKVKREIKILKFITHPNIIKLYQVLDTTNDIFVVMEMAEGGELYEYIDKHDFNEDEAQFFFQQIIDGVEYTHFNLVAHRDLKPENILLDANKVVKIADFGLSNLMKDGKLLKTNCGSLNYAAPEIIGSRKYEGTAIDVWSCGVILYTMLCGTLPFDEQIVTILYRKIEKADFTVPEYVSPLAKDLIFRMLQANPVKRIRINQIKNHPWLRKSLPIYAKIPTFCHMIRQTEFQLDDIILERVREFNMKSLDDVDEDRIRKVIKRRMDDSFVTAYQLLKDEKDRNQYLMELKTSSIKLNENGLFSEIQNKIQRKKFEPECQYIFGKVFNRSARMIVQVLLDIFTQLEIEYVIKNNQYALLCTHYPPNRHIRKKSSNLYEDKLYGYQDQERFSKKQIKFCLQMYTKQSKNAEIVIDLRLTQGHPLVFLTFASKFYRKIDKVLKP